MPTRNKKKAVTLEFSFTKFNKALEKLQALTKEQRALDAARTRIRLQYTKILAEQFESLAVELEKAPTPYVVTEVAKIFHKFYQLLHKQVVAEVKPAKSSKPQPK